ncbi:MAG: ATP-binding protein [Deltaproteobacteria bacterium]|nr:ATP-binding protein [Deltaproteobacteria bacterium]
MPYIKTGSPDYYLQLKRHFVRILLLASFIPLILIGGMSYYYFSITLKETSLRHLENIVRSHQNQMDDFLSERLSNLKVLATSYTMNFLLQGNHLAEALHVLQGEYEIFTELGIIDAQGNHVAYVGPYRLLGKNYKDAPWFKEVMERGDYISDVFLGFRKVPHIIMAVKNQENGRAWILRTTVDIVTFSKLVEGIRIGETVDAFIVNTEGVFQSCPRSGGGLLEKSDFLPGKYSNEIKLAEREDRSGVKSIYAYTWLQNRNWCLVVKQDLSEVYAALRHFHYVVIPIFVVGSFIIIFAAIFTTRQLASRIEQTDREKDILNEQLLQSGKLAAIGELAAGIAHEINNPLAIIGEEAGWMKDLLKKEDVKDSPNVREFEDCITQIKHQAGRCRRITHNLLSFARKLEPKVENITLNSLIEDVINLVEREARINDITITRNFDQELPAIRTDASQLRQVFLNIINNAVDAIGRRGEITVKTHLAEDYVCAEITDTGHGIAKENLDRIFLPFFTTKAPGKGTGLGLAICYNVIEKLGGRLTVESEEDKGTTFIVCLPMGKEG